MNPPNVKIRAYRDGDDTELWSLFATTIREICVRDYTPAQVKAWAPDDYDKVRWHNRMEAIDPFVATKDDEIVGYADLQSDGYIDHFYCHKAYQRQGVGRLLMSAICERAQALNIDRIFCHASITARPFFEHFGFVVVREQQVSIGAERLTNYVMERQL